MGKVLKTTKDMLAGLLNVTDQVPAAKLASDIGKHLGFRKAIKKHLKDYTDKKTELLDKFRKEQTKSINKQQQLEGDEEKKDELAKEKAKLNEFTNKTNEELAKITEDLKIQKVEVTFDNEDFSFEKRIIEENATSIFKRGEAFNADQAEEIFDLFDTVQ